MCLCCNCRNWSSIMHSGSFRRSIMVILSNYTLLISGFNRLSKEEAGRSATLRRRLVRGVSGTTWLLCGGMSKTLLTHDIFLAPMTCCGKQVIANNCCKTLLISCQGCLFRSSGWFSYFISGFLAKKTLFCSSKSYHLAMNWYKVVSSLFWAPASMTIGFGAFAIGVICLDDANFIVLHVSNHGSYLSRFCSVSLYWATHVCVCFGWCSCHVSAIDIILLFFLEIIACSLILIFVSAMS